MATTTKLSALWNKIKSLFGKPLYGAYVFIFGFACIPAYKEIYSKISELFPDVYVGAIVFVLFLTSVVHIFLVYLSMHDIEEKGAEWRKQYQEWIGSKFEITIRWLIVIFLLLFAGKLAINNWLIDGFSYAWSGAAIMSSLLLWDISSICMSKNRQIDSLKLTNLFKANNIKTRFFYSDLFGCLLWSSLLFKLYPLIIFLTFIAGTAYLLIMASRVYLFVRNDFSFISQS